MQPQDDILFKEDFQIYFAIFHDVVYAFPSCTDKNISNASWFYKHINMDDNGFGIWIFPMPNDKPNGIWNLIIESPKYFFSHNF